MRRRSADTRSITPKTIANTPWTRQRLLGAVVLRAAFGTRGGRRVRATAYPVRAANTFRAFGTVSAGEIL